jgi:hypothetical protein
VRGSIHYLFGDHTFFKRPKSLTDREYGMGDGADSKCDSVTRLIFFEVLIIKTVLFE